MKTSNQPSAPISKPRYTIYLLPVNGILPGGDRPKEEPLDATNYNWRTRRKEKDKWAAYQRKYQRAQRLKKRTNKIKGNQN